MGERKRRKAKQRTRQRRRRSAVAHDRRPGRAARAWPLRSGARQRQLRRRLHRQYQGREVAPDRRGRSEDPVQSRASRRHRRRPAHGRRRRHSGADPAQVLRQGNRQARLHAAGAGRIRHRPIVHAGRRQLAADHPRHLCRRDRARRADADRLARRAERQRLARRVGQADRAAPPAGVHRPRQEEAVARANSSAGSTSCASRSRTRSTSGANGASRAITRCRSPAAR